jgi:hypothetical protein
MTMGLYSSIGGPVNDATLSNIPMWEATESFSTVRGKHTLAIGADYRHWVQNRNLNADYLGTPGFNNDLILNNGGINQVNTKGCPTLYCGTGNALADFLLGYYHDTGIYQPGPFSKAGQTGNTNRYHFEYLAAYLQDDWKVTPRLTLNMGVRWDFRTIPFESDNKMGWLDMQNAEGGLCIADPGLLTKGIAPTGSMYRYCGRRNPADASKKVFGPRIGFAFRPIGEKTVIRAGYGVFFDSAEGREIDDSGDIYPYAVRTSLNPTVQPVASAPKLTDQLYPAFTKVAPVSPDALTFIAVIISERPRNPYVQQWSFSIQRELFKNTTLEANYIGNKGIHLLTRTDIAQVYPPSNPDFCSAKDAGGNYININNGDCPVTGRYPYPNFTGRYINSEWEGNSNYNSANFKLERRTSSLTMQAIYTWAKSMDNKSAAAGIGDAAIGWDGYMNNHNPGLDYGPSDFDVGQRFISNFVYQLPVGRGKHYLSSSNRVVDGVFGGWQVTGIVTFQKGFPYSVYSRDLYNLIMPFGSGNRANVLGNANSGFTRSLNEWFNTSAFGLPEPAHYGTSSRNTMTGPGLNNWDLGCGKSFSITERVHLQVRGEFFNAWNHAQYYGPDDQMTDANYGKVSSARAARIIQLGLKVLF